MELLERDLPLQELETALQLAAAGQGCMAVISGEAGIGKTALVDEFTRRQPSSVRVLWGACDALLTPRPLGPLHDIAHQVKGRVMEGLDSGMNGSALFSTFLQDLQEHLSPSLVVFEDVHWADEASLDLIKYLGRRIQRAPAMLILTFREDETGPGHPLRILLGDLATLAHLHRIPLAPLSENAVRRMALGVNVDADALHRRTGGNPFYVSEVLAGGGAELPASVRDAVQARSARLAPPSKAALEAAAVIGARIEPGVLARVVGGEAPAFDTLVATGMLISQDNAFAFRHELAREAILDSISATRRRTLHRLTLAVLRSSPTTGPDLAHLSHHASAAEDPDAVREYAPAAARHASAAGAHREAAAFYATALRFGDSAPEDYRAALLDARSYECYLTDQIEEAQVDRRQSLAIWKRMGNRLREGDCLRWLARLVWHLGRWEEADRLGREAVRVLERLAPGRELAMACSYLSMVQMLAEETHEAVRWGSRAIELAEQLGATEVLVHALNSVGMAEWIDSPEASPTKVQESLRVSLAHDLQDDAARAYMNISAQAATHRQYALAMRTIEEGIAYGLGRDLDLMVRYIKGARARVHLDQGHWAEALADAEEVLQAEPTSSVVRLEALTVLGRVLCRQGEPSASRWLDRALELATTMEESPRIAYLAASRSEAAWITGRMEAVVEEARRAFEIARRRPISWLLEELTYWMWRGGSLEETLPRKDSPYAQQIHGDWRAAAKAWGEIGCPYEQAMALSDGDDEAQVAALAIFERLGARPAAEMLRHRLQTTPQRELDKRRFGGLTAREREVAALIAQGKSNREISKAMVVGKRTIETYVTRILNKLGFDSRVQIATWAVERGLGSSSHAPSP